MTIPGAGRARTSARLLASSRGMAALRHRNYRLFFAGQLVSLIGTWMQSVAQSWLILSLTNDPFMLGLVAAVQFLPVLILGLFGGLIADALPKRQTLIATQASMMVLAAVLGILVSTHSVTVWMILVLAFLLGSTNAIDMPVRQAFAVEMVGRDDIGNAVALNSAMFNAARVVGPAIAGVTISVFDISTAFYLNAASFLAVIGGLLAMRDEELRSTVRPARPTTIKAVAADLGEGLRFVRSTSVVLLAVLVVGVASTFGMNFNVIIPAYSREVLGGDAAIYGFLMAAAGTGSLISALAIAFSAGRIGPRAIGAGALVLGLAQVAMAATAWFPAALGLMVLVGAGGIAMTAMANTTIQLAVPDHLRGRVLSVYVTVFVGSTPVGALLTGAFAASLGPPATLVLGGGLAAIAGVGGLWWVRAMGRQRAAVRASIDAEPPLIQAR